MSSVSQPIRQQVISEAKQFCEYCQTQQRLIGMPLVIDHIIPRSMSGSSDRPPLHSKSDRPHPVFFQIARPISNTQFT
jgi:hypothetical protein